MEIINTSKKQSIAKEKESQGKKPKLEEILKKLDTFRWNNYLKDYTGDFSRIQSLYWNLVYNDIVGRDDLQDLSLHIAKSYLGVFLWPHRCYLKILNQFDGLEFYQLNLHRQLWNQWKEKVLQQRAQAISDIVVLTHREPPNSSMVYSHKAGDFWVDWKSFDRYYIQKTPAISTFLKDHLRPNRFRFKDPKSPEISLPYELDAALINRLHQNGETIARSMILYRALSRVEEDKNYYLSSQENVGSNSKSYKHLHIAYTFSAYQPTTLSLAIKSLLKENPDYKNLSLSQMKYIIQTLYVNPDGKPFKDNSIATALRRAGFSNPIR